MAMLRVTNAIAGGLCGLALLLAGASGARAEEGLVTFKVLSPDTALKAAQAALADCRKGGYQVTVAVVDRFGAQQVVLRDQFAGPHTPSTATRKAWTAVSFRTDTVAISEVAQDGAFAGIRFIDNALMVGGGVPIEAAGSIVGGIGVSGAPSGEADDACARAGIEAVSDEINF
jgi:uncharacterized protein GlcG (DUF336 family)